MKRLALVALVSAACVFLLAAGAAAQPIGFNWSEMVNLSTDSGSVPLTTTSFAKVIWDKDKTGLSGWNPADPIPSGDEVVLDFSDTEMSAPFGSGPFTGMLLGNWTADDTDGWTQDGEMLYLLAFVPAAVSSSGLDEYGVSAIIAISGWPNNAPVSHDIVGGGPIRTAPVIHVNVAAAGPGSGTPSDPYPTIQAGLTAAPTGSVVLVAKGTYKGAGNVGLSFNGKPVRLKSKSGPQAAIIDGEGVNQVFSFTMGEGPGTIVDGFTIQNGAAIDGGGIYALASSPMITNCVIQSCTATNGGGGIYSGGGGGGAAIISNCLITGNTATTGGGVCADGSSVMILNSTLSGNAATTGGGVYINNSMSFLTDAIAWGNSATNGHELALDSTANPSTLTVRFSDVMGGIAEAYVATGCTLDLDGSNINQDPLFVAGLLHGYYLSQIAAGQGTDSPCLDAGGGTAAALGLAARSTRTDGVGDAGQVDMGYHAAYPLQITDVYWDQVNANVVIEFTTDASGAYEVQTVDAAQYGDGLAFNPVAFIGAPSIGTTTFTDNLTTTPLVSNYRFYRIKRLDQPEYSWQTAGVFELSLTASPALKFVSTPLVPDADHASVREVFGEGTARQIPRTGFAVNDLTENTGLVTRMSYALADPNVFLVEGGTEFDLLPGVGYQLTMGSGAPLTYKLRLTGYVPSAPVAADVSKDTYAQ
ncbi:MAG: hypothetical protein JW889_08065, partial [Verrucomicrobia bacterium]|nr:hypothetical protein [Verrucomicrobiota bacterium]